MSRERQMAEMQPDTIIMRTLSWILPYAWQVCDLDIRSWPLRATKPRAFHVHLEQGSVGF